MTTPRVSLTPLAVSDGERIECHVSRLPADLEGHVAKIAVSGETSTSSGWIAQTGGVVTADGTAVMGWEPSLGVRTLARVSRLQVVDERDGRLVRPDEGRVWDDPSLFREARCVVNGDVDAPTPDDLDGIATELDEARRARYQRTLGATDDPAATRFKVVCVVERLSMTTLMRLPGILIQPTELGSTGLGEVDLLNRVLLETELRPDVDAAWWAKRSQRARPWVVLVMDDVRAQSVQGAAKAAWEARDDTLHLLALNRGSSGRPIATAVHNPAMGETTVFHEDDRYSGNLMGGFISGEDQDTLLMQSAAIQTDPGLALCTRLFREALAEKSRDAAYFRFWSTLETLSTKVIGTSPGQQSVLTDGSAWPNGGNMSQAAPRVYELLKRTMETGQVHEPSYVQPAPSLYDAVVSWYARRNATAHYGAFDPSDQYQQHARFFQAALLTHQAARAGSGDPWLDALERVCGHVIDRALINTGAPLIR